MVEIAPVTGELATAARLVDLLERDGYALQTAVWTVDDEGEGRLYLVPLAGADFDRLREMVRVAHVMSMHKDELPDRHDLRYSVVDAEDPVIRAVRSVSPTAGRVRGLHGGGLYIDSAYILRPAA